MPATGTPVEQESNPSAPSSINSGGASAKQILETMERWKRAFNLYVASKGVTNEGQKVALLLHSRDTELQEIYFIRVSEDQDTSFNDWITILHRKLMFHFSDMFSAKCKRWKGKLSINLCAVCARRLYPVSFQAWMKPSVIRSSKNEEIQNFVENFSRNQVKQPRLCCEKLQESMKLLKPECSLWKDLSR